MKTKGKAKNSPDIQGSLYLYTLSCVLRDLASATPWSEPIRTQSANLGQSSLLAQLRYISCNSAARDQTEGSEEDTSSLSKVLHHDSLNVYLELEQVNLLLVGTVQAEDVLGLPQLGPEWNTLIDSNTLL